MLRAARRRVVEVAEECDPCRVLDAARAGHEGREGLREEELVDAREVAHERDWKIGVHRGVGCVARGDRPPAGPRWKRENAGTRRARERGGVGFAKCVVVTTLIIAT